MGFVETYNGGWKLNGGLARHSCVGEKRIRSLEPSPSRGGLGGDGGVALPESRGRDDRDFVGWVERSDTHAGREAMIGIAALNPSYLLSIDMSPENRFERELEHLREDSDSAALFLYSWLAINKYATDHREAMSAINSNSIYWQSTLSALQASLFIVLGRIFDQRPDNHSIHRLLGEACDNPQIFSRASLAARRQRELPGAQWYREYAKAAYEPRPTDFSRLRKYVRRKEKVWRIYSKIRHRVFAHNAAGSREKKLELFAQTNLYELQRLVVSLRAFREVLWQFYANGRKPVFKPVKYSIRFLKREVKLGRSSTLEKDVFESTCDVLARYVSGSKELGRMR
jgi:AbiU2